MYRHRSGLIFEKVHPSGVNLKISGRFLEGGCRSDFYSTGPELSIIGGNEERKAAVRLVSM